jgi:leucyl/phenylalanyl-tRNA---protein transferase
MDVIAYSRRLTLGLVEDAYRQGAFPMGSTHRSLFTWHRPDARAIIPLESFHVPRSLRRRMRRGGFEVAFDRDFAGVMRGCAAGRPVWITQEFHRVYGALHRRGRAHSAEVWQEGRLVGGLYGVHLGAAFFAESKFHRVTDASKVALVRMLERLRDRGFLLFDVQYRTPHLAQFGTVEIAAEDYATLLKRALAVDRSFA